VLRKLLEPVRCEIPVTKDWIKLHNKDIIDFYRSSDILNVINNSSMGRMCSMHGGNQSCIPSLVLSFMTVKRGLVCELKNIN
jgi:hypothetical protein